MKTRILNYPILSAVILFFSLLQVPANADTIPITVCDPLFTCAGTPTEGWDGAGLGAATIKYYVGNPNLTNKGIPTNLGGATATALTAFESAIAAAQAIWSAVIQVTWIQLGDALADALDWGVEQNVIYAAPGDHSDGNSFDGAWDPSNGNGYILAHAYGPPDIASGNLHLDDDELWVTSGASIGATSASIDLVSILLHEFGHVLGLGHPGSNSGDVMQPDYFGLLRTLSNDDILAARSLYACAGEGCDVNGGGDDDPTSVPEPGTIFLFATGLLALAWSRRRVSS